MCNFDPDNLVTVLSKHCPKAREVHICNECLRHIDAGERYLVETYVYEASIHRHKTCAHCAALRRWLGKECGGWLYTAVVEDFRNHAEYGARPFAFMRAAVAASLQWRNRRGRLLAIPDESKFGTADAGAAA